MHIRNKFTYVFAVGEDGESIMLEKTEVLTLFTGVCGIGGGIAVGSLLPKKLPCDPSLRCIYICVETPE